MTKNGDKHWDDAPERLRELARSRTPDAQRWGQPQAYDARWSSRSDLAARFIEPSARVLEIGAGAGFLRAALPEGVAYTGADLNPLEPDYLRLDLDADPMPDGAFDYVVLLGVLEYLHRPEEAFAKCLQYADTVILSYCFPIDGADATLRWRRKLGWVNDFSERDLYAIAAGNGHYLVDWQLYEQQEFMYQVVMRFSRHLPNADKVITPYPEILRRNATHLSGLCDYRRLIEMLEGLRAAGNAPPVVTHLLIGALYDVRDWDGLERAMDDAFRLSGDLPPWALQIHAKLMMARGRSTEALYALSLREQEAPDIETTGRVISELLLKEGILWPFPKHRQSHMQDLGARNGLNGRALDYLEKRAATLPLSASHRDTEMLISDLDLAGSETDAEALLRRHPAFGPEAHNADLMARMIAAPDLLPCTDDLSDPSVHGLFTYHTSNIGDDIQSLAALNWIASDKSVAFLDRDALPSYDIPATLPLIFNGWFGHFGDFRDDLPWPPPDSLSPELVSFHITPTAAPQILSPAGRDWFISRNKPVGCRDQYTTDLLNRQGIDARLTGCLTLTLDRPEGIERGEDIYVVDIDPVTDRAIREAMERMDLGAPVRRSHEGLVGRTRPLPRLGVAAALLREYAAARLVVTSRLHCALPCLAMGTPVIFVLPSPEDVRFKGLVNDSFAVSRYEAFAAADELIDRILSTGNEMPACAAPLRAHRDAYLGDHRSHLQGLFARAAAASAT